VLKTAIRRAGRLARFAAPDPLTAWRVWCIRRSGLFDRVFYRGVNPGLHPIYRSLPERHYVLFGEAAGLRPSAGFSPEAYLAQNPDLRDQRSPFVHYVRHGHAERRVARDPSVDPAPPGALPPPIRPAGPPCSDLAAVVHVFYPELWDEIAQALDGCGLKLDLYVTVAERGEPSRALVERIRRERPRARVLPMPNRGRDIGPFVHLVNSGVLDPYRAVLKLHTKRSPHREDGDVWRRHLIAGLLEPSRTAARLDTFLADGDAAFWIADGQAYEGRVWWGVNEARVRALMRRIEVDADPRALRFPAGSMYWTKPLTLRMLRGLRLRPEEFEVEQAQLDGTLAHAVERAMGYVASAAGQAIRQTSEIDAAPRAAPPGSRARFVSAFYLPQFHRTPENDAWWGPGYTEWTAAARARPAFEGHAQPALPAELGFYDLSRPDVMGEQAALARGAGIDAFCVYHYWFDGPEGGRRLLEAPMDGLLARPGIDFPFYLCWANESWRRNWDGLTGEVLVEQAYAPGFEARLAASLVPYMRDARHLRPDGERLRLVIYRPEDMPDPAGAAGRIREALRREGLGEVELGAVRFHLAGAHPVPEGAFDFWVEMPPHGLVGPEEILHGSSGRSRLPFAVPDDFAGLIYDYAAVAAKAVAPERADALPSNTIAGVMPAWDNTARRGLDAHIAWGAHPAAFRTWLRGLSEHRLARSHRGEVMLNAWNEWGERAVLEPSDRWGRAWLEVLAEWRGAERAEGRRAA
jgi:lipopolysaccharide biosynthesis protein